jgi:PAS domain S-box-containing protein
MYRILSIDDEPALLEITRLYLERSGEFTVTTCAGGREALALLEEVGFDLIISDYQMPEMDGITLLKLVRSRFRNIPFILFTGKGREEVVIEAFENGADFYIQKGGDPRSQFAELSNKIRYAISRKRAEQALRESEERLTLALEGAELGTWDYTIETGETVCNERWARMLEYSPEESSFSLLSWESLVHPEDLPGAKGEFQRHIEGKVPRYEAEYRVRTRSGGWISVLDKGKVIERDDRGEALRAAGTHLDITGIKQAEEMRIHYGRIFESSQNEIYLFDLHTLLFLDMNCRARENLGYSMEELRTMTPLDLKPEFTRESFDVLLAPLRSGEKDQQVFFTVHRRKDGSLYPVEVHLQIARTGIIPLFFSIILDITEHRRMERALKEREERIVHLSQSLDEANRRLNLFTSANPAGTR